MKFAIIFLFSAMAFGQSWTGILAPVRGIDWSTAGLPPIFPNGETTLNPWTPPTRTQCVTSQCNTVSGGSVTATTINSAITSAPASTYVFVPAGTFNCAGTVNLNKNYITLRAAGAATTKLTGCTVQVGDATASWGGASFLTANPSRLATSITVASPPTAGRLVMLEECDHNHTSSNAQGMTKFPYTNPCAGTYVDPVGPWVCGQTSGHICNFQSGGSDNPHFQTHVQWVPTGGVSGTTVNLTTPLWNGDWVTSRSAVLTWLNVNGVIGTGVEGMTVEGGGIDFTSCYACWFKGIREIGLTSGLILTDVQFSAHTLMANSYIAETQTSTGNYLVRMGFDGGERGESDTLFINNTLEGGFIAGFGDQVGDVYSYYYMRNGGNSSFMSNGYFNHHGGTSYLLQEGVQGGRLLEDQTWSTHNFNTFFRNYLNCTDPVFPSSSPFAIKFDPYARFGNIVGNSMGGGSGCGSAYTSVLVINPDTSGTGGSWPTGDPTGLTTASTMVWGNYIACSGDSRCNTTLLAQIFTAAGNPSNLSSFGANSTPYQNIASPATILPASFFMNSMTAHPLGGTGLSWWKVCDTWTTFPTDCAHFTTPPFPTAGPDVTGGSFLSGHAYNNPAAIAWAGFPTDPNYTTAWGQNLRQFDERAFQQDNAIPMSPAASPASFAMNGSVGISGRIGK